MTNEVKQSIITRFREKSQEVFIGFSDDGEFNIYLNEIDKEGRDFIEQFLLEIAEESEKRTIEKVANWIRENYIDADIVAGLPEAIERMKYES